VTSTFDEGGGGSTDTGWGVPGVEFRPGMKARVEFRPSDEAPTKRQPDPIELAHEALEFYRVALANDPIGVDAGVTDPAMLSDAALLERMRAAGAVRRRLDAELSVLAGELAARSRAAYGQASLAKRAGFRDAEGAIAQLAALPRTDALDLRRVAEATRERESLTGEPLPPACEHVAAAHRAGALTTEHAALIVGFRSRLAARVDFADLAAAERILVEAAPALETYELRKKIAATEAELDPDGLEPNEQRAHRARFLSFTEVDGSLKIRGQLPVADAAPIRQAIEGITTAQLRASRGANRPGAEPADDTAVAEEVRSVRQMQVDALVMVAKHALGCDADRVPGTSTNVVVRLDFDPLTQAFGDTAEIAGTASRISAAAARRMAASAGIIPLVLGGESEVLDLGRTRRLASRAQRIALVERDGGCAFCGLAPAMCEAHHVNEWLRHGGRTDLDCLILLCTSCHHRLHHDEWIVRIIDGVVWFVPPPFVDLLRSPRLGGRLRTAPGAPPTPPVLEFA
jgi:5-methylcytosine-specific restriction protein A